MLVWARYSRHAVDGDQSRMEGRPTLVGKGRYCEPNFEPVQPPVRYDHRDTRSVTKLSNPVLNRKEWKKYERYTANGKTAPAEGSKPIVPGIV